MDGHVFPTLNLAIFDRNFSPVLFIIDGFVSD
jgi:hypothetical protein